MGCIPALYLRRARPGGRDLLLRHRHSDQPAGGLSATGPVQGQAVNPVQGNARRPVPAPPLLPGPGAEPCGPRGGASVWGGQPGSPPGGGAPQGGRVSADIQRARRR